MTNDYFILSSNQTRNNSKSMWKSVLSAARSVIQRLLRESRKHTLPISTSLVYKTVSKKFRLGCLVCITSPNYMICVIYLKIFLHFMKEYDEQIARKLEAEMKIRDENLTKVLLFL